MKRLTCLLAALLCLAAVASAVTAQDSFIAPGSNLVVDGIPKIPAALARKVARYTNIRSAGLLDWHPTKREMLISTRFANTAQVHQVKMPAGTRTQLTFFADGIGGARFEPNQGNYFVFSKGTGGNERYQNYRFDVNTGDVTLLTDGTSRNSLGVWNDAGNQMVYTSTRRTGRDTDLYLIDPADPKSNRLLLKVDGGGWFPLDWSPDGTQILLGEYVSINESYLWLVDVAKQSKSPITPRKTKVKTAYLGGAFSKDGKSILTPTDNDSEFRRLVRIDLASGKQTVLTPHINWDIEEFEQSPDGTTLALIANEMGIGTLHLLDAKTGKERKLPKMPAGSLLGLRWRTNQELGLELTSARSPTDVYSLHIAKGIVQRWTFSETGGLNTSTFSEPELVRWKSFDDREITGFLYRPPAKFKGKRPVILFIHGGPESQFRPKFLGQYNYLLNELGIAILFPNVRGSAGFGKTYLQLDNGFLREGSYKDIKALLDWIPSAKGLDADRVMVMGGSYGGFMTLAVATNYADKIRCAVDVVGISNFVSFLENTEDYRRDLRRAEYGDERDPKMRAFMERIAPLNKAKQITRPLFIVQGKNDPRVPLIESEQMVATLKKLNIPVWYLMATDEGHGFRKKQNADFQFYATILFIREHLLGN